MTDHKKLLAELHMDGRLRDLKRGFGADPLREAMVAEHGEEAVAEMEGRVEREFKAEIEEWKLTGERW